MGDDPGYPTMGPLARPGPLRHQVEERLRMLIVNRDLAPGQHLVEAEIAARLQVSRGPVREALQALHSQGWVDLRPGRGAFVHEPTTSEVDEVFGVRAAVESEAASLAARCAGGRDISALRRIAVQGRRAVGAGEDEEVVVLNSTLHGRIAGMSGNALLAQIIASLDSRIRWYLRPVVRSRGYSSWDEHDALIEALADHDPKRAGKLMRQHTERTREANARALAAARV